MAIQNFLSGGFYGKVGDVVGQRWHNKRIIRAHVIPYNPRTEAQQAHRAMFALATSLAQEAYNINKGSKEWDTTEMPQFSQMVKTAYHRLAAGATPAGALPLHPDGIQVNITLASPTADWTTWDDHVTISDTSYKFPQARNMAIIVFCYNELTQEWHSRQDNITINAGSYFSYVFKSDGTYSLPEGSAITAVTTDDDTHRGDGIQLAEYQLMQPHGIRFDMILSRINANWTNWPNYVTISDTGYKFPQARNMTIKVYCFNERLQHWQTIQDNITINAGSQFNYQFNTNNTYSLPTGAKISAITNDDNVHLGNKIQLPDYTLTQPSNVQITVSLTGVSVDWSEWSDYMTVRDTSYTFPENRGMTISIYCKNERIQQWQTIQRNVTINAGTQFSFKFTHDNTYSLPAGSYINAVSNDDSTHKGNRIQMTNYNIIQSGKPYLEIQLNYPAPVLDRNNERIYWVIPNILTDENFERVTSIWFYITDPGKWLYDDVDAVWYTNTSIIIEMIIDEYCTFPTGSYIDETLVEGTSPTADIYYIIIRTPFSVL